ncbi:hypothetical protein B0J18DRAFT_113598 [Chaetomium sp. MPI-SDFR-AT-0129]|nr:hypothetical protein B0J18DRAFT_113598 [Chaetomium sp. MPI-SDFR-AT-0129]
MGFRNKPTVPIGRSVGAWELSCSLASKADALPSSVPQILTVDSSSGSSDPVLLPALEKKEETRLGKELIKSPFPRNATAWTLIISPNIHVPPTHRTTQYRTNYRTGLIIFLFCQNIGTNLIFCAATRPVGSPEPQKTQTKQRVPDHRPPVVSLFFPLSRLPPRIGFKPWRLVVADPQSKRTRLSSIWRLSQSRILVGPSRVGLGPL